MKDITVRILRQPTNFYRRWYWEAYITDGEWVSSGYAMTRRRAVKLARNAGYLIEAGDYWEEDWEV